MIEVNFDGLVGPTHNYAGLSVGNLASMHHGQQTSNPRAAALEGLEKMALLCRLGLTQAILPPHERPHLESLRRIGFTGSPKTILERAATEAPHLLASFSSASPMWTANAGTMAPGYDTLDGRAHFTPANLASKLHRSIEAPQTLHAFRTIFPDSALFEHHPALPTSEALGDEGAANHTRLAPQHGAPGIHLFVYGQARGKTPSEPLRFPARQTLEASQSVARLNQLPSERSVFACQSAQAINAGVFHNDVICVGNEDLLFFHEACFENEKAAIAELQAKWNALKASKPLRLRRVTAAEIPLEDAVRSYLFNSQLVTLPSGKLALIAPGECATTPSVKNYLDRWLAEKKDLAEVHYPSLRQSMANGGGPACLRFRVVLTEKQRANCHPGVFLDLKKIDALKGCVEKHYRERLVFADLADENLWKESCEALEALTQILGLGSFYAFQRS
ncbi:N-succinylarginine dihydrolase [bacterium]|nr:N-succinylarginine dihydrolase [bacterium]